MDPISGFATIASLVTDFVSQRRAEQDVGLEEFKVWLASQRHEDIITLLNSNTKTAVGIKALLHSSHADIMKQLEQIRLQTLSSPEQSGQTQVRVKAGAVEVIVLGINNSFVGNDSDISNLATRCAVYAIEGKAVEFQIELQKTVLETLPDDPLVLPRYEKARQDRAQRLKKQLEILTSKEAYEWWQHFLYRKEDWAVIVQSLIARADFNSNCVVTGKKIDVWRTEQPELSAPIYLSEHEVAEVLEHLGFQSISLLRMGAYWRAAFELPSDLIVRHIIPSIIVQLERWDVPASGDVLNLAAWHIGEG